MTESDKQRIEAEADSRDRRLTSFHNGFRAGAEYEHPHAYEQGFQDGFKKQDNEMYNQAIEDVLKRSGLQLTPNQQYVIQKLKK